MTNSKYRAPIKSPLSVCLWLTDKCNLSCRYCYAAPFSGKVMDTQRLYELIDELRELEVFDIAIAGGEPFLHPQIFEIIERLLDIRMQVGVLTNGILLKKSERERLAWLVKDKHFILQISLDSNDPSINDITRGKGAEVVDNLHALAAYDIKMQLSCVLTSFNIKTAHRIIDEFYPAIKRFHFLNIQRTAFALNNSELLVNEDECRNFWLRLNEYAKKFPPDLFLPSLRIMLRAYGLEDEAKGTAFHSTASFDCPSCSAGITHINIDADFNVLGCDIAKDYTIMGNLHKNSFEKVWNSPDAYKIRNAPSPACYKIKGPTGESMADDLKPEFLNIGDSDSLF